MSPATPRGTLVVDDDNSVRQLTCRVLERFGWPVLAAASGDAALDVLATRRDEVGLVLLDRVMPGLAGPELYLEIAARWPDLAVVVVSGSTSPDDLERYVPPAGARPLAGYLVKPWGFDDILAIVSAHLGRRVPAS